MEKTQSKFKSWSAYNAQRGTSGKTVIHNKNNSKSSKSFSGETTSSSTSNISAKSASAATSSLVESVIRDAKNAAASSNNKAHGMNALYVPSTQGIDTMLQFQWVRVHPSTAFMAAHEQQDNHTLGRHDRPPPSSVELSGMVYQNNDRCKKKQRKGTNEEKGEILSVDDDDDDENNGRVDDGRELGNGGDCIPGGLPIELTDLFDPPLLSEWIPGVDTNCFYAFDDEDVEDNNDESHHEQDHDQDVKSMNISKTNESKKEASSSARVPCHKLMKQIIDAAVSSTNMPTKINEATKAAHQFLDPLGKLSAQELADLLPSHLILSFISSSTSSSAEKQMHHCLSLAISILCLLSEQPCASESMGKHIVRLVAPVILNELSYSKNKCHDEKEQIDDVIITDDQQCGIRRIADNLVSKCKMGFLEREALYDFLSVDEEQYENSQMMMMVNELMCCISESYFSWREQHRNDFC